MRKLLLFVIVACILSAGVFAVPPGLLDTQSSTEGLIIEYPSFPVFNYTGNITLHFHIYNSSGFWLDNTSTDCGVHLYEDAGEHLLKQENLPFTTAGSAGDFEFKINDTTLAQDSFYSYVIYCNSTSGVPEYGFVSSDFEVTATGDTFIDNSPREAWQLPVIIILLGVAFFFILLSWYVNSQTDNNLLKIILKYFTIIFSFVMIIVTINAGRLILLSSNEVIAGISGNVTSVHDTFIAVYTGGFWFFIFFLLMAFTFIILDIVNMLRKPTAAFYGDANNNDED